MKAKHRPGRPPLTGTTRTIRVHIRLTAAELVEIQRRAMGAGEDVSTYLRRRALSD